jgi:hypothetical protein
MIVSPANCVTLVFVGADGNRFSYLDQDLRGICHQMAARYRHRSVALLGEKGRADVYAVTRQGRSVKIGAARYGWTRDMHGELA